MNPAWSVVFLTVLCGAAQGLTVALLMAEFVGTGHATPGAAHRFFMGGALIALALSVGGLIASFFHLGRPERAWRTATQWRSSWLSREVIALPIFMLLLARYAWVHAGEAVPASVLMLLLFAACFALWVCTAMIYAGIPFIREWSSPLTFINFVAQGMAAGFVLATLWAAFAAPRWMPTYAMLAQCLIVLAFAVRMMVLARNRNLRPQTTVQSAIGIHSPKVRQVTMGATGGTFNTREFFHGKTAQVMLGIKWTMMALGFAVPLALLVAGWGMAQVLLLAAALLAILLGQLAERWYFFAEANHPQNHYYQSIA